MKNKKLFGLFCIFISILFISNVDAASKVKISKCKIKLSKTSYIYTGNNINPTVTVKYKGKKLKKNKHYKITYSNNKKAGTATVTIKGKGSYKGTVKKKFKITKKKINNTSITLPSLKYNYSDNYIKPAVTVKIGKTKLKLNTDYTVQYSNNYYPGKATVTITGKGSVTGTYKKTFTIVTDATFGKFDSNNQHLRLGTSTTLNFRNDLTGKTVKTVKSSNTNVIKAVKWTSALQSNRIGNVNKSDVYAEAVGKGMAIVTATTTDGKIARSTIYVDDTGISVVKNNSSYSTTIDGIKNGNLTFGQEASSVIGQTGLEKTNGYEYNHPSGLAYYKKNETVYYVVTDTWNNRVLIYTGSTIDEATSKDPTYILGQDNKDSNTPGYELDKMNWPMDCAIDSTTGTLYIADTHNNRILVYDNIENVETGKEADHEIAWWNSEKTDQNDHLYWPWSVSTDVEGKLIVTSTLNRKILIWNTIPSTWEETDPNYYPDTVLETEEGSTPRAITWTGTQLIIGDENIKNHSSGLRVFNEFPTDALAAKPGVTKTEKSYQIILSENDSVKMEDFVLSNINDPQFNGGYGEGTMIDGKLYIAFGSAMHIWTDGRIDDENDGGIYTFQIRERTFDNQGGIFLNGGGIYKLLYAEGNLYLALHNGNYITGWKNVGTQKLVSTNTSTFRSTSKPDIYIGTKGYENLTKNVPASKYVKHNLVPLTDGKHLVLIDDLDQQVMVYKNIPTSSGAEADYVYNMPFELGEGSLSTYIENGKEKVALIVQSRTQNIIYIWIDYKFDGSMPNRVIGKSIGSKQLTGELNHIEFDGKYTYISTVINNKPQVLIYKGLVKKNQEPLSIIDVSIPGVDIFDNNLSISSNGNYVSFMYNGSKAYIFKTNQFTTSSLTLDDAFGQVKDFEIGEEPNSVNDPGEYDTCSGQNYRIYTAANSKKYHERGSIGMLGRTLITSDNKFVVTDTSDDRVIIWNSIDDAIAGDEPTILGHGANLYDMDEVIGKYAYHDIQEATFADTMSMPLYPAYDGYNLWIGEFKFSNRLLRYALK